MKKSPQTEEELKKVKEELDQQNLGLDADQSSEGSISSYNNDNDQVSGNSDHPIYSPLEDK